METYYERMQRKRLERKAMSGIAQDDLVLTDGSGQQVGTYSQKTNSLQKQAAIKKMKNDAPSTVSEDSGVDAEVPIEAGLATAMEGGGVVDIANSVGKAAVIQEIGGAIKSGTAAYKAAAAKTAATAGAAKAGAATAGLKAGAMAVNPYVLAGAAAIGLVAGAQAKKRRKRQAEAKAKEELSLAKQREAAAFGELSKSIKGMLS